MNGKLYFLDTSTIMQLLTGDDILFNEAEWLRTASQNSAFDFLKDKEEDIYNLTDGKPSDD